MRLKNSILILLTLAGGFLAAAPVQAQIYTYQWQAGKGSKTFTLPPSGIALDAVGNLYAADYTNNRIQKFDSTGKFITAFGTAGNGDMAVDRAGNVYVTGWGGVFKFAPGGRLLRTFGSRVKNGFRATRDGQFEHPHGIAVDRAGNVYVTDTSRGCVQKFNRDGKFLLKFGSLGGGNGQFVSPCGIAVDAAGHVYVANREAPRIQKFDSRGRFIGTFGPVGRNVPFGSIEDIAVDGNGSVYVADGNSSRIMIFARDGTLASRFGSYGWQAGGIKNPQCLTVDGKGNVYVADGDQNSPRIQKFRRRFLVP